MKFIKQSSIDKVLEEADIYNVVSATEKLTKKGTHYFCISPFQTEKTGSFCVNRVKNYFHCYSSGISGNAITFLMKKHPAMSFFEAIEQAAQLSNITLEYETVSDDYKRLHDEEMVMKKFCSWMAEKYQAAYSALPDTSWPKEMMQKQRGYSQEILESFMIGYVPDNNKFISNVAIDLGQFEISKALGYTRVKDGSSYDFFRDRVMFPIHNDKGYIVGFGGRVDNGIEKYAKYLNSPESKLYHKEKVLYGFFQAKRRIAEENKAILLEGYTDVIALHDKGVTNSVATCGTSLTEFHAKLLSRVCKHVILFRDGDAAGHKASIRDIDILLAYDLQVSIVVCPPGEDPDSLAKNPDIKINEFIEKHAEDAILWKTQLLQKAAINPEIEILSKTLNDKLDKDVAALKDKLVDRETLKNQSALDRKFSTQENNKINKEIQDLEREVRVRLDELPKYSPNELSEAVESIAVTLHRIPNKIKQGEYVKQVCRILPIKAPQINQIITTYEEQEEKEKQSKNKAADQKENTLLGLPEGANKDQYLEDLFCEIGNSYHFNNGNGFFLGTNFKVEPLFHVKGKTDNKRLCEVTNTLGHKCLIDFESTDLINFTKFKERLIQEGVFFWEPGVSNVNFLQVSKKLLKNFHTALELKTLGYQKEGFFAFADGVYHNNEFKRVNKYGIVNVEGLEKSESEYGGNISHFYSPAYSEIYKHSREDDDPYENDRYFIHKVAPVSLEVWMKQMIRVFGNKGKIGILFCIAANFRDLFLKHWEYFPILGGFGQRDSGKSGFGSCLQAFFFYNLPPLELNTSTLVASSRRLTRTKNVVNFFDEYRDDIDEEKRQQLKGVWNGVGREKGKGVDNNRTSTDKINSALYMAGQYLPTGDDNALPSRIVALNFEQKEYTSEEKEEYSKLKSMNNQGLSSFILEIIKYRKHVESNIVRAYTEISREMKDHLKNTDYQNRVFENHIDLLVIMSLLNEKVSFPFSYEEMFKILADNIVENSDSISDSDGLAAFWRVLEYLSNPEARAIREGQDYEITKEASFTIQPKKGVKDTYKNRNGSKILFLNFSKVHQDYHKEVSKRQGEEVIGANTVRNYLKTKKYFIGLIPSRRMGSSTTSCYAFDYTMMNKMGILSLHTESDNQTELELIAPRKHKIHTNPNQQQADL
ncbi:DNA primase [Flavobacterium beibuense]|uniref:DNA primase n=1 Tax=Flavobacterium beibuense TaxID=657326 RepID=UPI003A8DD50F